MRVGQAAKTGDQAVDAGADPSTQLRAGAVSDVVLGRRNDCSAHWHLQGSDRHESYSDSERCATRESRIFAEELRRHKEKADLVPGMEVPGLCSLPEIGRCSVLTAACDEVLANRNGAASLLPVSNTTTCNTAWAIPHHFDLPLHRMSQIHGNPNDDMQIRACRARPHRRVLFLLILLRARGGLN
jgi:hypothetical protein